MADDVPGAGLPEVVVLRVGEVRELVLPGLGTSGYRWSEVLDGDSAVVELAWRRGFPAGGELRPIGASAPERLSITGASPGRVSVRLVQQRPWEQGRPRAERAVDVQVLPPEEDPGR
ncbi:MAG: protease inhibitor I42 family protein [Micropruina sp.]|uniref:protease inhibitor I42 family protein n=1 Tax=Micropruina sp. TaxID=2737536 RepID=UPI0039E624EB